MNRTAKMIRDALDAGIQAAHVLMDTWFTNEPFIKKVLDEDIGVIGMLKDSKQHGNRVYQIHHSEVAAPQEQ